MTLQTISLVVESGIGKSAVAENTINAAKNLTNCPESYKAQRIRWLMLIIFICFTFINSVQWGEYIIISNLVQKYYGVSGGMVDNTTVVYMITYIPLIFPALWLLEKKVGSLDSFIVI